MITEHDIEKKSKQEAFLVSYRIRVKAEDLQKALNPAIWPMRVKVREYIYYSSKGQSKRKNEDQNGQISQGGSSNTGVQGDQVQEQRGLPLVPNRYNALNDNASGDQTV